MREKDLQDYIDSLDEKPNVIFDCVCTKSSLEQSVEMVSVAGRVVELGFGEIKSEISHVTLMRKEVDVCGTRLQAGRFPEAIEYIAEHRDLLGDFITQQFSIDRVEEAFRFVGQNPALVRKAQIMMDSN